MSDPQQHKTLFAVPLADRRARQQIAGERRRGGSGGHHTTSDVNRYAALVPAALFAVLGLIVARLLVPSAPSRSSGALALPHRQAGVECSSCHKPEQAATDQCVNCHQPHPSTRSAHRRLMAAGTLTCARCHDMHADDQGVRFLAAAAASPASSATSDDATAVIGALRYGVAAEQPLEGLRLDLAQDATVPLIPLARCSGCHALTDVADPIQRCIVGQPADARQALSVCFDEHQRWSAVETPRPGGVCQQQHGNDRFAVWDAARDVAATAPASPTASAPHAHYAWLFGAGAAGLLGLVLGRGLQHWRRTRKRKSDPPAALQPAQRVRLPQIDVNTCLGCYACVDACPYDVLEIERYVAKVSKPDACCGLTLCEQVCPNGSLVMTDGDIIGERPRLDEQLRSLDNPQVYLAGDITGAPLIKNAILQGHRVMDDIAAAMPKHSYPLDVVIVGAGPAGISAALRAKELGLRYQVVEQGSVAQSIRSFPRGKLVFAQPLELPLAGKLWLEESSKEELLAKWLRIVRQERLSILEHHRFVELERRPNGLRIYAEPSDGPTTTTPSDGPAQIFEAACLLLAIGHRGSPRQLPIALSAALENKVFYHLADAHSFGGKRVVVVGLGDVAMEAAVAIARQADTQVTMVHRGKGFNRGKSRNIAEVKRLWEAQRLEVLLESEVEAIEEEAVVVRTADGVRRLRNDALLVMIGNVPPTKVLHAAGVRLRGEVPNGESQQSVSV